MRDASRDATNELVGLLDDDPDRRAEAVAAAPAGGPTWFALRAVLLFDAQVPLRAAAAARLGEARDLPAVVLWLCDALDDPFPSVRQAAYQSLGRLGELAARPALVHGALEEPVWWVRRSAVQSLARVAKREAVPHLRRVLDDPFWRVRHAALRALAAIGEELHEEPSDSPVVRAALRYLDAAGDVEDETRLMPEARAASTSAVDGLANADPAVTTARLEVWGSQVPPLALVPYLADAHRPLRQVAAELLASSEDVTALTACLEHLRDVRIAHAPAAIQALLDALDWPLGLVVAERALDLEHNAGATAWALTWIARHQADALYARLCAAVHDARPLVRRAAAAALAQLAVGAAPPPGVLAALRASLVDDDADVRSVAAAALAPAAARDEATRAALAALRAPGLTVAARVALVRLAQQTGDHARLASAAQDAHPFVRASALEALVAAGALSEELRQHAAHSADPWARSAVLDPESAVEAFDADPDPQLRRAALELIVRRGRALPAALAGAADRAVRSVDPYLRARSALLLRLHECDEQRLRLLLELSRDPEPMVRVSADEVLESCDDLPGRLRTLLRRDLSEPQRIAAWGYLVRERTTVVAAELAAALADPHLEPQVAEQLRAMALVLPEAALASAPELAAHLPVAATAPEPVRASAPRAPLASPPDAARRLLGRTGIAVSPLGLSGAYQLPVPALKEAVAAGVNLFFWEPHYLSLTRFVREQRRLRDELALVAGSFHGSAAAIRQDVETALRRLHTDHLDLFLLFWARSRERLSDELNGVLRDLKAEGKIRAAGFSTHHRELALEAIGRTGQAWDAIMIRHSAAHTAAEVELLPRADAAGVGVITFSALCYGRLLQRIPGSGEPPTAADCYRYSLSQAGVTACLSAPRRQRELAENLAVLAQPVLSFDALAELRAHGAAVHEENRRFNTLVRQAGRSVDLPELEPTVAASESEPEGRTGASCAPDEPEGRTGALCAPEEPEGRTGASCAPGEWPAEPAGTCRWANRSDAASW